jgi:hypothetical protein
VLALDFTVIGFPKCGTSALIQMLAASPALFVSTQKSREARALEKTGGPIAPDPPRPHGNKLLPYIYAPSMLKRVMAGNARTLFIVGVRPCGEAMLSWYDMHREIALEGRPLHFAGATLQARAFYGSCTVAEYFEVYARERLRYADNLRHALAIPEINYVIVTQARLARDARGVMQDIHARLGARLDGGYLQALPTGHARQGSRDIDARIDAPGVITELRENDRQLLALLDEIDPSRVLRNEAGGF